ncbi:flagellar biosynthetic protein FliR [Acetobacterium sp.]|jgi:flagellar biosynthetic protein FliR|uniref:flagellar biosynthetic protein FliR n=1 Tax=Acetobacterium sp. TaxID=1872094 RepID=UPI000CB1E943|nr:flagellar biosynthetic protein FliR [Acetobacterium sp.]MDO9493787.1 flagellar biosynthetic protein FliR [Acetobacterium sp.]PKM74597.1 MAG: flagellar biosynthetic protein FliR [Firmicutes bacterium HGW-Firmicutes-17]
MNQYLVFLLASCRTAGVIFFNPIFGRNSIPSIMKVGLSLAIAMFAVFDLGTTQVINYTAIEFIGAMLQGFIIGIVIGFIMTLFLSVFQLGGEVIDMQMGLSMASMYDPATKANISVTGNLLTSMYVLIFFISNAHLALFTVVIKSFQVIPLGIGQVSEQVGVFFIELMYYIFIYAVQLAIPIIVTEIIAEFAVGILMRLVPNINVFVINIQIKVFIGLIVVFTIIPALANFMTQMNLLMMEKITQVLTFFI